MEKLRQAVQSDCAGNEAAALQLYVEATGGLFRVIKAETNPERKAKWTAQLTQYLDRAEALKRTLAVAATAAPAPAVSMLAEAQRRAMTRAVEVVFDRFAVGGSLGLPELNALNAVSGDEPLDSATMQRLTERYDCTADARLLPLGLVALMFDLASADGLSQLQRILACHGFDEEALRELETERDTNRDRQTDKASAVETPPTPSASQSKDSEGPERGQSDATAALPHSAAELALQLGLRERDSEREIAAQRHRDKDKVSDDAQHHSGEELSATEKDEGTDAPQRDAENGTPAAQRERVRAGSPPAIAPPAANASDSQRHRDGERDTDGQIQTDREIFVKNIGGSNEVFCIPALGSDTIGQIKAILRDRTGIPVERQQIIFAGGMLQDSASLSDCKVTTGTTIHLIFSPPVQSVPPPEFEPEPEAAPAVSAVEPPRFPASLPNRDTKRGGETHTHTAVPPPAPASRYFYKAPLAPAQVTAGPRPLSTSLSLPMIHQQSAERVKNQLGTLMAAAPKPDADFGKRLEQGAELLRVIVATVDAEWRCLVQLCGRDTERGTESSMASNILKSQTHRLHVTNCVGWIQTAYIDGAPDEFTEKRRSINSKAEQIAASAGRLSATITPSPVAPPAERHRQTQTDTEHRRETQLLELGVRFFCCDGGEMRLVVSPSTAIATILEDLQEITGPSPDPSKPDCLVVLGRKLSISDGSVADCGLQNGQTLYLVGANRVPPRPLPATWTVDLQRDIQRQRDAPVIGNSDNEGPTEPKPEPKPEPEPDPEPEPEPDAELAIATERQRETPPIQAVLPVAPPAAAPAEAETPRETARETEREILPPEPVPAPEAQPHSEDTEKTQRQSQRPCSSSATDPWYELPTLAEWGDRPGLRISYDVAESENEIVQHAIEASASANGGLAEPALLSLQSELQAAMIDLETRLEHGWLSLSDYAAGLQSKILADKRSAVAHKQSGEVEMAKRLLRHSKLMQRELDEIRKEVPAPSPARPKTGTHAGGKREPKSETARALQPMMNQVRNLPLSLSLSLSLSLCVCVCVCVRARARVCVCAYVRACARARV